MPLVFYSPNPRLLRHILSLGSRKVFGFVFGFNLTSLLGIPGLTSLWQDVTHDPGRSSETVILFQARFCLAFK